MLTLPLQELIQEKHELRLRLEGLEQEYEVTVRELHHDVASLRHELGKTQEAAQASERAKNAVIQELTQQNERLTDQLKKVSCPKVVSHLRLVIQRRVNK